MVYLIWIMLRLVIQLAAVYFFEYVVSVGFAAVANPKHKDANGNVESQSWFQEHAFELLAFCYQVGVLISRSSISIIQVRKIWILTTLQGLLTLFSRSP